jgi:hypothetical protein
MVCEALCRSRAALLILIAEKRVIGLSPGGGGGEGRGFFYVLSSLPSARLALVLMVDSLLIGSVTSVVLEEEKGEGFLCFIILAVGKARPGAYGKTIVFIDSLLIGSVTSFSFFKATNH